FSVSTNIEPKRMSGSALELLKKYSRPGNVRELKNLVERLMIMSPGKVIEATDIPAPFNQSRGKEPAFEPRILSDTLKEAKNQFERAFLESKLREYDWNISQTAEAIGIERSNLHKKIKAYGLEAQRS
ncbi:MAG: sigma-54-dependent Fis family transcriptional regulator, partial [Thermoplasmata archaeon]